MIPLAVLAGLLAAGGVLIAWSGWQAPAADHAPARTLPSVRLPARPELAQVAGALAVGVVVLVLTRQLVLAIAAGLGLWVGISRRRVSGPSDAELAEAIALWTESLRNGVVAADGVETVLTASARHAPQLIRADVERLVARLPYAPLDGVLAERTGTLQHPAADLLARALGQAAREGASLQPVLDRLAQRTRGLAEMHRRIEVARQQPRSTLRIVTAVIVLFTLGLFTFARSWTSAYETAAGQLVLLAVVAWGVLWWRAMARMARVDPVQRYYAAEPSGVEP